jgi:hypothetical protein
MNLKLWKMHLPIDNNGLKVGNAKQVTNLVGFTYPPYFLQNADGSLTFSAPVDGAKTSSNTKYARSELREMSLKADGSQGPEAAWTLKTGGTMVVTTQVDRVPTLKDGKPGRVVIGQIHGADDELVRLYRQSDGLVNFYCDLHGTKKKETLFQPVDAKGVKAKVALGEKFSYKIVATTALVTVIVTIKDVEYKVSFKPISVWTKDKFYFKAGIYLGVNATQGTGDGQVTLWDAEVTH